MSYPLFEAKPGSRASRHLATENILDLTEKLSNSLPRQEKKTYYRFLTSIFYFSGCSHQPNIQKRNSNQKIRNRQNCHQKKTSSFVGSKSKDLAASLNNLANVLAKLGHLEDAETLHRRAWQLRQQHLGAEHQETRQSVSRLGWLVTVNSWGVR